MKQHVERSGRFGFTLVEALVAMLVTGIGMAGTMSLVFWMVRAHGWSGNMTAALNHGQDKLESFRNVPYDQIGSGSDAAGHFTRTWTINRSAFDRYRTVELEVVWTRPNDAVSKVAMKSLTSNPAMPGADLSPFGIDLAGSAGSGSGSEPPPDGGAEVLPPTSPFDN